MNKTLKIITILLMTMMVVLCTNTQMVFATGDTEETEGKGASSATDVLTEIKTNITDPEATDGLAKMAGSVIGLIRVASAVAAVILVAVFGFKFIMGSANEKADYQKSFIPLIVGVVVVFSSTYIAEVLFTTFSGVL